MTLDASPDLDQQEVLGRFSEATRAWFTGAFAAPTPAQLGAWDAVSRGQHALVVAPTGSGKTLSAFLWALDGLAGEPVPEDKDHRCRVLYVSPLKALAVDVERNLRSPLTGIRQAAQRLGLPVPEVRVGVRSGDTSQEERRGFTRTPPDVLITTPESLFLLLTSKAREQLRGVRTVVLDEVHAMAGSKRGAHLALSLERLDALVQAAGGEPTQRVGLSATVRPVQTVAEWVSGGRPVTIVQPPSTKEFDLRVVVPVEDMSDLDASGRGAEDPDDLTGQASGGARRASIWPHVEERIVDLVAEHRSTLVFANSRRLSERLTARLNEVWDERLNPEEPDGAAPAPPAQLMGQAGTGTGAPAVLARAHHGSVSKEQRSLIEEDLKAGRLPAVVATSSLELGIDMGAVDLVVQVESPPSVASGLQRVGRAGHQVGAVSRGVLFPKFRGDLLQTAVVVERMRDGRIEELHVPANPLDVLAQQIVAMVAMDEWTVPDLLALAQRAAPFATLSRAVLDAVLDMLSGRYPSDEFAELRPRLVWDRVTETLTGRPGAQRLAVTSGGTIPDRGLFAVFLATGEGPGRRVGELDEEMVYESRVGDVITLGSSAWRVEDITHDRVLVTPAPGQPGRLPFWHGEALGRPAELGRALGEFVRELGGLDGGFAGEPARERVRAAGLDDWATGNLLAYLTEQQEATRHVPDDQTIVVERFRDELGDWRICIHSPFGGQVHSPWALALGARMRERFGVDVQAMPADDGIVLRLPDLDLPEGQSPDVADLVALEASEVAEIVTAEIGGSALFASRFRECAARALLLPRRQPGKRQPLWQQRQRAASLLEVASRFASFPIVLETVRECLSDVFDVTGLERLMTDLAARKVRVVEVESQQPSPFARGLMFGYVAQFLYEGDSPLAERRAAALALDPSLLAELLGRGEGAALRDLLDPEAVQRTEDELQRLVPERRCADAEDVADLLRVLGPLTTAEVVVRSGRGEPGSQGPAALPEGEVARWLVGLEEARRLIRVRIAGEEHWAVIEDAGRLRDGLGTPLPVGIPEAFTEPVADPLAGLFGRYARTRGPFTVLDVAARFGVGRAVAHDALRRLQSAGRLVEGELRPGGTGLEFCDADVLRILRRRSLAALRADVEPVPPRDLARFLPAWQGVSTGLRSRLRGVDGVLRAVEQLAGAVVPASAVEPLVLAARVEGYSPAMLDELTAAGEVVWSGHGSLPGDDGWVSLHPADLAPLTLPDPRDSEIDLDTELHRAVLDALAGGGAYFFRALSDAVGSTDDPGLTSVLWDLVWAGRLTNDTLAPLRNRLGGRGAHKPRAAAPRSRYARTARPARGLRGTRVELPSRSGPPSAAGRWSLLPEIEADATVRAHASAEVLLDRHGVLTRGAVASERVPGGFAAVYRVLAAFEDAGRARRGYFVEGLGASQFATTGAVDRLRDSARPVGGDSPSQRRESRRDAGPGAVVLAATDPANPYGAALPWPERPEVTAGASGHRPGRKAGALVVVVDGDLVLYVERGGRSVLSWTQDPETLQPAADALALSVRDGVLGKLTVEKADGSGVLQADSPLAQALESAGFHATPRGLRMRS
ncbi:ATP-dependent helicase [Kineococcus radiotolerans]|uniref:DEAD/H associated domain protein n=1 Tax=Kineococcus radiotolerans (strain ATCC BAA-149 / DSM 14245 / SRS30216) TaxID=266940 RepID=A6W838_KINRD|nr:ATP-dependent helicase [Kineococcus radiotolerans]ABS02977.1 DEAD/H associated domain protein [Kineococcus radiotolerans SRS30216 = ATCC BAA-149]